MKTAMIWTGRLLLAGVFLAACAHKILHPAAFAEDVYHYQLLPPLWVNGVALTLPWLEAVCAIALLAVAPLRRSALIWIGLMLLLFAGAQAINLARGVDISCGCFSSGNGHALSPWNLIRNLGLLAVVLGLLQANQESKHRGHACQR